MDRLFDQLNLKPHERRILVLTMLMVFVVLNMLFVWPHFGDLRKTKARREKSAQTLTQYQEEIARIPTYEARLRTLESQGSTVLPEAQALKLMVAVQRKARESKVTITGSRPLNTGRASNTNLYFDEQTVAVDITTGDKELVDFLVALSLGDSMIRVRDLDLRPDSGRHVLNGRVTLVASYQRTDGKPASQ